MPRPRQTLTLNALPAGDLVYAVNELIARGKTSAAEIRALGAARADRIAAIQRELAALNGPAVPAAKRGPGRPPKAASAMAPAAPAKRGPGRPRKTDGAATHAPKRKFTTTAKVIAARKRQGRYIGLLNRLKGAERARVQAVAHKDGVANAIAVAGKIVGAAAKA